MKLNNIPLEVQPIVPLKYYFP